MNKNHHEIQEKDERVLKYLQICRKEKNESLTSHRIENLNKLRIGHWTEKENSKYFAFLLRFRDKFLEKGSRRQWKVFKTLSTFVKTRDANQCRSHHHKMQKSFQTIEETLLFLKKKIPSVEENCIKYSKKLEVLEERLFNSENVYQENPIFSTSTWKVEENFIQNKSCPQTKDLENELKEKDISNLKTDIDLEDTPKIGIANFENLFLKSQNFSSFPSTGLLPTKENLLTVNPKSSQLEYASPAFPTFQQSYNDKLLECQILFSEWYSKVSCLMKKESEMKIWGYENFFEGVGRY